MTIKGITKLPISISAVEAVKLLEKLSKVTEKIGRLDEKFNQSVISSYFFNTLLLQEAVHSNRIEEAQVTFVNMVEQVNQQHTNHEITEVKNYQSALNEGAARINNGMPISIRLVKDLHKILFSNNARGNSNVIGDFRETNNYIASVKSKKEAVYIPVEPAEIDCYMENWELFINGYPYDNQKLSHSHLKIEDYIIDENSHPLFKAAVMHAQFESIHPFVDGNGRVGRILIALYMVQTELISKPIFLISGELERHRAKYYTLLNQTRGENPAWYKWIEFFLESVDEMANNLLNKLIRAEEMAKIGIQKCDSTIEQKVYFWSFSIPNLNTKKIEKVLEVSSTTARRALNNLADLGLLFKDETKKRNVEYFNYDVLDLFR